MPTFPDADQRLPLAEDCRRCPALVAARNRICWGAGPRDAALVVVGEAPAAGSPDAERWRGGNWTGMAYSGGRSGKKIRTMVEELGHEAYYTNAVKCFPSAAIPHGDPEAAATLDRPCHETDNREPHPEERANCRPYLREEVERIDPDCVLATGRHATESLLAVEGRTVDGFLDLVLERQNCPTLGVPVLPVLHPSYQEVWIARLGYDRESYLAAIDDALAACGVHS
ncbi:uracil-DNA glycosylase [Halomarina rubra]|uniref:Uracil-DNA glycosylase family protein n=1 Tax=Halomarina rubra TaxID=2071873 RepID=A0ABD6ATS7_9EURY|nr:uracil-DNA glycosylase family protein [Halomarina rubra]